MSNLALLRKDAKDLGIKFLEKPEVSWEVEGALEVHQSEYDQWRLHDWYYFGWHVAKVIKIGTRAYFVGHLEIEPPSPSFLTDAQGKLGDRDFERRRQFSRYAIVRKLRDMGHHLANETEISYHATQLMIGDRGTVAKLGVQTAIKSKSFIGWLLSGMQDTHEEKRELVGIGGCKVYDMRCIASWETK